MAGINFGKKGTSRELDKAMAIMREWTGPIAEQANKSGWGKTVTKNNPELQYKAAMERPQSASPVMTLLGAAQGYLSGSQAGEAFSGGLNPGDAGHAGTRRMVGGALGAIAGAAGMNNSLEEGLAVGSALGGIAEMAQVWEKDTKQRMAEDAVASMSQEMATLNRPASPQQAIEFAERRDQLVNNTAQQLFTLGVAPDKAVSAAQAIAAINDPTGTYASPGQRYNRAVMEFNASPQTPEDKRILLNKLNAISLEQQVVNGEAMFSIPAQNARKDALNASVNRDQQLQAQMTPGEEVVEKRGSKKKAQAAAPAPQGNGATGSWGAPDPTMQPPMNMAQAPANYANLQEGQKTRVDAAMTTIYQIDQLQQKLAANPQAANEVFGLGISHGPMSSQILGNVTGTSAPEAYLEGIGVPTPWGKLGGIGKGNAAGNYLSDDQAAFVRDINSNIVSLSAAASRMMSPDAVQQAEYQRQLQRNLNFGAPLEQQMAALESLKQEAQMVLQSSASVPVRVPGGSPRASSSGQKRGGIVMLDGGSIDF